MKRALLLLLGITKTATSERRMSHRGIAGHVLVAAALLWSVPRSAEPRWFAPDRIKHFFLSFFVQSASYSVARAANADRGAALIAASGVTAAAAISKEVWDRRRGTGFSSGDLVWDALGAGAASALLVRTVDR
jgi:uncharacterized protein YfiM (DUF2279 family)